jgi:hypothetical protein
MNIDSHEVLLPFVISRCVVLGPIRLQQQIYNVRLIQGLTCSNSLHSECNRTMGRFSIFHSQSSSLSAASMECQLSPSAALLHIHIVRVRRTAIIVPIPSFYRELHSFEDQIANKTISDISITTWQAFLNKFTGPYPAVIVNLDNSFTGQALGQSIVENAGSI